MKLLPIRVALSGSGFLLPAHVGALQAIRDGGYEPIELAGTSGGSIVATLAAHGMSIDDMRALAMTTDWRPLMPISIGNLLRLRSISAGRAVQSFVQGLTHGATFRDLVVPLKVMASNLATKRPYVFSREATPEVPLAVATRASAAIPGVYEPVILGDAILFDGGMVDNMPGDLLTSDGIPRIGIDLVDDVSVLKPEAYSLVRAAPRLLSMLLASSESAGIREEVCTGVRMIRVPTGFASSLDRKMPTATRHRLYSAGYQATRRGLAQLLATQKLRQMPRNPHESLSLLSPPSHHNPWQLRNRPADDH